MRRHPHHRPSSIIFQDVVSHKHRYFSLISRVNRRQLQLNSRLFLLLHPSLLITLTQGLLNILFHLFGYLQTFVNPVINQLRRYRQKRYPQNRVQPRRENFHLIRHSSFSVILVSESPNASRIRFWSPRRLVPRMTQSKNNLHPLTPAYPVSLRHLDLLRPPQTMLFYIIPFLNRANFLFTTPLFAIYVL